MAACILGNQNGILSLETAHLHGEQILWILIGRLEITFIIVGVVLREVRAGDAGVIDNARPEEAAQNSAQLKIHKDNPPICEIAAALKNSLNASLGCFEVC